jgi:hypothetical protein
VAQSTIRKFPMHVIVLPSGSRMADSCTRRLLKRS